MATAYRQKYPEAAVKEKHYQSIIGSLKFQRDILKEYITNAKTRKLTYYESTKLSGDYYKKYVDKKNDWLVQLDQITAKFDRFLLEVDECIKSAETQADMWKSRMSIMEAYDDGRKDKNNL